MVHAYVEELLKELQQPTQSHSAQMLALMQEIAEIEPSISPDGKFLPIPPKPKAKDYDTTMRDWFADIEDLTWSIYQRLGGADSPILRYQTTQRGRSSNTRRISGDA